jgi:hypothetical protein
MLTKTEIKDIFINSMLEGDYNFLEDDLVKLANAFVNAAAPKIIEAERVECIKFTKSLNHLVGEALQVKRASL